MDNVYVFIKCIDLFWDNRDWVGHNLANLSLDRGLVIFEMV